MKPHHILIVVFLLISATGCNAEKEVALSGRTMGTTYHIKVLMKSFDRVDTLQTEIDRCLEAINQSMSIYRKDSEISRFNDLAPRQEIQISTDFQDVLRTARTLHNQTHGAWDGTVGPLVELWGFGRQENSKRIPATEDINRRLRQTGFQHVTLHPDRKISKAISGIALNLGSIAKGYGVDQITRVIEKQGYRNFLVEIGGEVVASGRRADGGKWRIGINRPEKGAPSTEIYKVVALENKALATSGDYRNFFEQDGKIYSHVIDPRTGYPVANQVVSVTIIADTCTYADGLATAIMVMGAEKGLALINQLPNVEGLIITMLDTGKLIDHYSTGFQTEP